MTWDDVKAAVATAAPMLGTLLGGPGGAAIGALISSALGVGNNPEAVMKELTANPLALVKLKEIEARKEVDLQGLVVDQAKAEMAAAVQNAGDINKTMQAEAASEHFLQFSWRPFIGYAVAIDLVGAAIVVLGAYVAVMLGAQADILKSIPEMLTSMATVIGIAMPILGVASWFRGKEKIAAVTGVEPPVIGPVRGAK